MEAELLDALKNTLREAARKTVESGFSVKTLSSLVNSFLAGEQPKKDSSSKPTKPLTTHELYSKHIDSVSLYENTPRENDIHYLVLSI